MGDCEAESAKIFSILSQLFAYVYMICGLFLLDHKLVSTANESERIAIKDGQKLLKNNISAFVNYAFVYQIWRMSVGYYFLNN
jgi:hypothetical protein